jgi:2-keto-4-pentenoate hydratase/2-oxohepta-3-ene-1,7-dioic acid hydratase in catechol pathway
VKLASFRADGRDRIGILIDDTLIEILGPGSILELIEAGSEVVASANTYSMNDVVWYPPVRRPSKICCLALNNSANSDRILEGPKHPAMFIKPASSLPNRNWPW